MRVNRIQIALAMLLSAIMLATTSAAQLLPDVAPLDWEGDLATRMVDGARRPGPADRRRTRRSVGPLEPSPYGRLRGGKTPISARSQPSTPASGDIETIAAPGEETRWRAARPTASMRALAVFGNAWGEGLLVEPDEPARVAHPPARRRRKPGARSRRRGQSTPCARRRRRAHLIPCWPIARTWSGHPDVRMTNQPHRRICRAPTKWAPRHRFELQRPSPRRGLARARGPDAPRRDGLRQGGLLALHAADTRIGAAVVSAISARARAWANPSTGMSGDCFPTLAMRSWRLVAPAR